MGGFTAACFDEYDVVDALLREQCFKVTLVESPYVEDEEEDEEEAVWQLAPSYPVAQLHPQLPVVPLALPPF